MKASNFIKMRPQHRWFPVQFPKYLTTPILKNICERLLLLMPMLIIWVYQYVHYDTNLNKQDFVNVFDVSLINFKGGLSGSDDLAVFKCFRVIFFLKNQTIQFSFLFNLYFQQKRAAKLSTYHLLMKRFVRVFDVTNKQNGFYNFQRYH